MKTVKRARKFVLRLVLVNSKQVGECDLYEMSNDLNKECIICTRVQTYISEHKLTDFNGIYFD